MKRFLKSTAISIVIFVALTFAVGFLNSALLMKGPTGPTGTAVIILVFLVPALVAGLVGGWLSARHGLLVGLASSAAALLLLWVAIFPAGDQPLAMTNHVLGILVATLAGGVGELYALRAAKG